MNTEWLPDAANMTKIIVQARLSERRIGDFDKLREAVKRAWGIELLVETEKEVAAKLYS